MKSIFAYLTSIIVVFYFSGCVPPPQQGGKAGASGMSGTVQLLFLGAMVIVFWMFFIRPQAKRAKNQKKFIKKVNEDGTLNIEVSPGSYLKIEKSAISMDWTAALNKTAPEKK